MTHYDIAICTPGVNFDVGYIKSLMATVQRLNEEKISYKFFNGYSSIVSDARNNTICDDESEIPFGGKITYNKMMWIDSDMGWTPDQFLRLYESEKDIIGGVYLSSSGGPTYGLGSKMMNAISLSFTDPFRVLGVGFGLVAIKSGVFEDIAFPWFEIETKIDDEGKRKTIGEDFVFCNKALAAGYETYVDPSIKLIHYKVLPIEYTLENMKKLDPAKSEKL